MIVVIGNPVSRPGAQPRFGGRTAETAAAAARAGGRVEIVGKVGEDDAGDALLLALARAGIGHVALLRDPSHPTPVVQAVQPHTSTSPIDEPSSTPTIVPADPSARPTLEPADVDLALRYLSDYRVVVVAEPQPDGVIAKAADAAAYAGADLVVVVEPGRSGGHDLPPDAIVFEAPPDDPEGAFAEMLGQLAAALDRGAAPKEAFRELERRLGVSPADD